MRIKCIFNSDSSLTWTKEWTFMDEFLLNNISHTNYVLSHFQSLYKPVGWVILSGRTRPTPLMTAAQIFSDSSFSPRSPCEHQFRSVIEYRNRGGRTYISHTNPRHQEQSFGKTSPLCQCCQQIFQLALFYTEL